MLLSRSLLQKKFAGIAVSHPLSVRRIPYLPFGKSALAHEGETHPYPIGGSFVDGSHEAPE